jgi:exopolysaccharide biosynthesis polyprenyl glycosylphosphotransferase
MSSVIEQTPQVGVEAGALEAGARFAAGERAWWHAVAPFANRFAIVFLPVYVGFSFTEGALRALGIAAALGMFFVVTRIVAARTLPLSLGVNPSVVSLVLVLAALAGWTAAGAGRRAVDLIEMLVVGTAVALSTALHERRAKRSATRRRVLIVGAARGGEELVRDLGRDRRMLFEPIGVVDDMREVGIESVPLLGKISDLGAVVAETSPDLVVLTDDGTREAALPHLLDVASLGFRVVPLHHFHEHAFGRVPVDNLSPVWFMSVLHLYQRSYSRRAKRAFDLAVVMVATPFLAPLLPLLALLVRLSSPGPILYRQVRLGERGEPFRMLKFRTMVVGAEQPGTAVWAREDDPRITRPGRLIRRLRLDELPQLWNVVRGEMSIVGPRPERPEFLEFLREEVPFWTRRHLVKPGVTGWAQVRHHYTADAASAAEKLSYDLYYLKHRSLMLDLAILARTALTVAAGAGSR